MVKQRNSMIESEITLEESLATFSETDKLAAQRSKLAVWPQEARERLKPAAGYRKRNRQRLGSAGARADAPGTSAGKGPRAKEKAPPMSGTPYPPTDFLRSTFGEEGLNFRVRNGIG